MKIQSISLRARAFLLSTGMALATAYLTSAQALAQFSNARQVDSAKSLPKNFDSFVGEVLKKFDVPGVAIAVVSSDQILLTKGYGIKSLDTKEPVDEFTLFPIASNSKAFTGAALGLLVDEGKIRWDDKVIQHLPWFKLGDPYVTAELTIEDLLVHRSGIAPYAGDLLQFPPTTYTRRELAERLQFLPLTKSFRSTYAYDNVLYLVAGLVIQEVSGLEWETFIKERIFRPVGMEQSVSKFSQFQNKPNIALSHAPVDGRVQRLYSFFDQGLGDISNPAGGIASNVNDMAKWVQLHLDSGLNAAGQPVLTKKTTTALWKGVTPMNDIKEPEWTAPAQRDLSSYGLGFRIYTYRGLKAVTHGGKLDGYVSYVKFLPDLDIGIVILSNQESNNANYAIVNHLADHFIGAPKFDWITGYRKAEDIKFRNIGNQDESTAQNRRHDIGPSLSMDKYAGKYKDAWYGDISIQKEDRGYVMRFEHSPLLVGVVTHWQYDTFLVTWDSRELRADAFITFALDHNGEVNRASMKAVSRLTDVSYDFHDLDIYPVK